MKSIVCITLSNTNNLNLTDVHTSASPETIVSILLRNGWIDTGQLVPRKFRKGRVFVTLTQKNLIEDADGALNLLFFQRSS